MLVQGSNALTRVQGSKFKGAHRGRRSRSSRFKVQSSKFKVLPTEGGGAAVQGSRFKVQRVFHTDNTELTDKAAELRVKSNVLPTEDGGAAVQGLRFKVQGCPQKSSGAAGIR